MPLLRDYTRFGLGGPADAFFETADASDFIEALRGVEGPHIALGGGTNLVVADEGFRGTVLRYMGREISHNGTTVIAQSGADLEAVVLYAIEHSLAGMESMMRIPGWVSGAIYGNAGAYGQSIHEVVSRIEIWDGATRRWISNAECGFTYRSSSFKTNKYWIVLTAEFALRLGDRPSLTARAEEIRATRDAKFPPSMRCAGSIFKNCFMAALPEGARKRVPAHLVREGKVPSAYFLEQVGAKGVSLGGIRVADYHANLIYNAGGGTASEVVAIVDDLRARVEREFGFTLEPEVQFIGFPDRKSY